MPIASDLLRVAFHRRNPDVSLENHMRQKRIQLGASVASIQRIYLDLRFWLMFRDVSLGRSQDKDISDLLNSIKSSVSRGTAICPISESVFIELLKQSDESTKLATAQLIDELSRGVTLIPSDDRIRQELRNSFYEQASVTDLIPAQELVWTKLGYVLGEIHPFNKQLPAKEELVIQKAFSDHIWELPLVEILSMVGAPPAGLDFEVLAAKLNSKNRAHKANLKSFAQIFRIEFEGGLSLFRSDIEALLNELGQCGHKNFGAGLAHLSERKRFEAFAMSIPTLNIYASCHAAVRWDEKRNLSGNDLFDFHHAQAALGYCDVFLTEKPLGIMLSQRHLGLTKYKCYTFWEPRAALSWLRKNGG